MALETWAHRRIENGENIGTVRADVLTPASGPAAYLLVTVDLVLRHSPNSAKKKGDDPHGWLSRTTVP